MNTRTIIIAVAIVVVFMFVWYGMPLVQQAPLPPEESSELVGSTWVWQETQLNNEEIIRPREQGAFTVTFDEEGRISGTTDCNSFSGAYSEQDGALTFGSFASTKMFCQGSQEAEFTRMVMDSTSYLLTPTGELVLHIKYDSGSVIFIKQ